MIAANYRKYPEAMALQLVLVFGACVWHTSRPTTRAGRAIRAAVGRAFKAADKIVYPVKPTTPQWVRDLGRLVRKLGQSIKAAQICLDFAASSDLDSYEAMIERVKTADFPFKLNATIRRVLANIPSQKARQTKLQHWYRVIDHIHQHRGPEREELMAHDVMNFMHAYRVDNLDQLNAERT